MTTRLATSLTLTALLCLVRAGLAAEPPSEEPAEKEPPRARPIRGARVHRQPVRITLKKTALNRILATLRDGSKDLATRIDAIGTLALAQAPEGVAPLISILGRQDKIEVKVAAVWALGELGNPIAIPALLRAHAKASGPHPVLRYDKKIEFPGVGAELSFLDLIEDSIGRLGVLEIDRFVRILTAPSGTYRSESEDLVAEQRSALAVIVCVGDRDPAAIGAMIDVARSPAGAYPADFRRTALFGLARVLVARTKEFEPVRAEDKVGEQIITLLTRSIVRMKPGEARNRIAGALSNSNPIYAVTLLTRRFVDNSPEQVRMRVIEALGLMRTREAVETLVWALRNEESPALRWRAAYALGRCGPSELGLAELKKALKDPSRRVRRAAVDAIGRVGGERRAELIAPAAGSDDPGIRAAAARALGRSGDEAALEPLLNLAKDESVLVRATAVAALGGLPRKKSLVAIVRAAEDADRRVRFAALQVLSRIHLPSAYAALFGMLDDVDRKVRADARNALYIARARHADTFRRTLVAVIRSRKHPGTAEACHFVTDTKDAKIIAALRTATEDERPAVRAAALRALRRLGAR
ncbi:MAG: HEAT repeat domain-containing protein [Planctomycetota bacterium]